MIDEGSARVLTRIARETGAGIACDFDAAAVDRGEDRGERMLIGAVALCIVVLALAIWGALV